MILLILSMQRSGSTELCQRLCKAQAANICMNELFTFSKCPKCYRADPLNYILDKTTGNTTVKLFDFNFPLNHGPLIELLKSPGVCPIILERKKIEDRYCSWKFAHNTGDWGGHLDRDGKRFHPHPCYLGEEFQAFSAKHKKWYSWLRSFFKDRFHVDVSFEDDIENRSRYNDMIQGITRSCYHS